MSEGRSGNIQQIGAERFGADLDARKRDLAGWMDIRKSIFDDVDRFTAERQVSFAGGAIEVRRYSWSKPVESVWTTGKRCYLFHMALDGGGPPHVVTNLRSGRNAPDRMGRLAMVPPEQELSSISQPGSARGIRCLLDAELLESFLDDVPDWQEASLHEAFHLSGGQIEWLMRRMYREMTEPDFATVPMLEVLSKQLAVEIVRKFRLRSINDFRTGGLAPWRMQRIRERLHADDPLPDLAELATLCDMTVRHLARAFRTETGQTLGKYREQVMVERATQMLGTGMTIRDVGMALGFSGAGGFRSAFRRATGFLPGEIKAPR